MNVRVRVQGVCVCVHKMVVVVCVCVMVYGGEGAADRQCCPRLRRLVVGLAAAAVAADGIPG